MKWRNVSISLLVVLVLVAGGATVYRFIPQRITPLFHPTFTGQNIQLGYYDMMNNRREIYDVYFSTKEDTTLMTLTSPDDNRFIARVRLQERGRDRNQLRYNYQTLYYSAPEKKRIMLNILNVMANSNISFTGIHFEDKQLIIIPSGQMISYAEKE
ncbi:hypothetical protein ACGVWS_07075 [Enterobacteriaceae bacterium LUAb1]